ncbi:MAG: carbon-monoxide dehydrogenase medium subunit, partial [Planctomycetota bacterium]
MYPQPFRYHRPHTLKDAITLLAELGEGAKPLAGGQSLIPILKMRMDEPSDLVDITRLPELSAITNEKGIISIGALCTHSQIALSEVATLVPILKDCAGGIADPQVRSLGTIGGSVSVADPSSDWPALLHVLQSNIVCQGPNGSRTISIRDFIVDSYTTSLGDAELVTAIQFKLPPANSGGAYIGFKKAAPSYPAASVGIQLTLGENDSCVDVRLALGSAGPKPVTSEAAEAILKGKVLTGDLLKEAAEKIVEASDPPSDARGSSEFKRVMLKSLFRKTATTA